MTRVSYRISGTIGGAAQEDVKDTFTEGLVAPDARIARAKPSSRNACFIERKVSYFETHTSTWRRVKSPEWHATNSARANLVKDHKSFNTMRWSLSQPLQSIVSYVPIAVSYSDNSRYIWHSQELGTPIVPNSANLCVACLRNTWVQDLRSPISSSPAIVLISPKAFQNKVFINISMSYTYFHLFHFSASVAYCRNCERFLSPPGIWTIAQPESPELLSICLKKLKGLNKVRLTDARFIWTEPHSKRLRVAVTIQKEVRPLQGSIVVTRSEGCHIRFSQKPFSNRRSKLNT